VRKVRLSAIAHAEIAALTAYGIEQFGARVSRRYLDELYDLFATLAERPELGVAASQRHPSVRRYPFARHMVFYEPESDGVLIIRIIPMARIRDRDRALD
jgi:toxin ParE1/3/4